MKSTINKSSGNNLRLSGIRFALLGLFTCFFSFATFAQDEGITPLPTNKPVKATFESTLLIDNQTIMIPAKGSFQFDIQHRFGTIQNGFKDLFGFYAPSNIRLGFFYVPIENLSVGFGFTKANTLLDFNAKYSLLKQYTQHGSPVSVTYYGNMVVDPRGEGDVVIYHQSDRLSFFHQLIIARKISDKLSVQVAPSLSHYNLQSNKGLNSDHYAVAVGVQYKVTSVMSLILNVDQPLTKHTKGNPSPNPSPNLAIGMQVGTSSHSFQFFLGNYNKIIPQENNMYFNGNDYTDWKGFWKNFGDRFRLGFNITHVWN